MSETNVPVTTRAFRALARIVEAYDAQQTMADTYDATMEMDEAVKEARAVLLAAWQEVTK